MFHKEEHEIKERMKINNENETSIYYHPMELPFHNLNIDISNGLSKRKTGQKKGATILASTLEGQSICWKSSSKIKLGGKAQEHTNLSITRNMCC